MHKMLFGFETIPRRKGKTIFMTAVVAGKGSETVGGVTLCKTNLDTILL